MKKVLNDELIGSMREKVPEGMNLANYLMDVLCIGKEAVYRRLRGDVAFSFDEVAVIAKRMGISMDKIVGNTMPSENVFELKLSYMDNDPMETYYEVLTRYDLFFNSIRNEPTGEIVMASNMVPYTFFATYEYLSRFRICRWLYQNEMLDKPGSLGSVDIPEKVINVHRKLSWDIRHVAKTTFILDENVFLSLIKEIRYFYDLLLISADDYKKLKEEILCILKEVEYMTAMGEFDTGNPLSVYLSQVNFDSTYVYVESKDTHLCLFKVYTLNSMDSHDAMICKIQKDWIHYLKRHSVLVSKSGEIHRIAFFNKQREYVNDILVDD